MSDLRSGRTLNARFVLVEPLGSGGMGEAWRARDLELARLVVVKILPAETDPELVEMLRLECRTTRRLVHPNIVRVHDFFVTESGSFMTMELIEGGDLCRLRGGSAATLVRTLLPLIDALDYAHRQGVIHRDLKCSNVLLDARGQPHLTDFGVAGLLRPRAGDLLLAGGGSRYNQSPQQLDGEPPTTADDLYALGVLLYELITGHPPFWPEITERRVRHETPPPMAADEPMAERLQPLVASLLAKSVAARPPDMASVGRSLEELLREPDAETGERSSAQAAPIRLTPPPRARPLARAGRPSSGSSERAPAWRRWGTTALLVLLTGVAVAVFVELPRWVPARQSAAVENAGEDPAASEPLVTAAASEPTKAGVEAEPERGDPPPPETARPPAPRAPQASPPAVRAEVPAGSSAADRGFQEAMSVGLAALAAADFEAAETAFQRALTLSPGAAEAQDGLRRVAQGRSRHEIERRRQLALAFEQQEDWRRAADEYGAVLAVDPTLRFATVGRRRAAARAELSEQLELHLGRPERLSSEAVAAEARALLERARTVEPRGPELQRQIDRLNHEIERATRPVRVRLVSDGLTEVVIYRVGELGRFEHRELELKPGSYTVVGRRAGYRDVRRQLRVVAGQEPEPLSVLCQEKI